MVSKIFSKSALCVVAAVASFGAGEAAASTTINGPSTNWLVQSYPAPQGVVLWYTGSPCANGQLVLDANDTADRNKLLAAMVLASKASGSKMLVEYDVINGACIIHSFGVNGP